MVRIKLQHFAARARKKAERLAIASTPAAARFYLKHASSTFHREHAAVAAGIREYEQTAGSGEELYLLRRNIHMLEKGLTMQPRRDTFGLEYIGQTVSSFMLASITPGMSRIGSEEQRWMKSVLDDYFEATQTSSSAVIAELRTEFAAFQSSAGTQKGLSLGPHAPAGETPAVSIDDLYSLAERRKSVRWFTGEVVDRAIVDKAVQVAAEAPTACNRQPYRFEVFDDPESVSRISAIPMGTNGYRHQLSGMIVVIGDQSAFFDPRDRHLIYVDSCLAATGLILGLEAQGVGTCCINWPDIPDKEEKMKALLGLQDFERVIMLIAFGYPNPDGLVPYSAKRDLNTVRRYREL